MSSPAFQTAQKLWLEMVDGVREMHAAGYLHRDLKPDNILVSAKCSSGPCHAKVADLGMTCYLTDCRGTSGTPYYLAPELVRYGIVDRKNDVWALGLMLFRLLNKGHLPKKIGGCMTLPPLEKQIVKFSVTAQEEYAGLPDANGLKELLTHMLALDHTERWDAESSLNFALERLEGCHRTGDEPLCADDPTRAVSELPGCWAGDELSAWRPSRAPKEVQLPALSEPVFQKQESLQAAARMEEEVSDTESVFFQGDHTETRTVAANAKLGCVVDDDGTVTDWHDEGTQARDLGVDLGWIVFSVAGEPFEPATLDAAMAGEKGETFEVVFKVPQDFGGNSVELGPDGDDEEQFQAADGLKVSIKMHTVRRPGNTLATNFFFRPDHIDAEGTVTPAWAGKATKKYVKPWPLQVGDRILRVNERPWQEVFADDRWKKRAKAGLLGALKIEYARAAS